MDNWIYYNTYIASFYESQIHPLPASFSELFITPSTYEIGTGAAFHLRFIVPHTIIPNAQSIEGALQLVDTYNGYSLLRIWSGGFMLGESTGNRIYYDVYYR